MRKYFETYAEAKAYALAKRDEINQNVWVMPHGHKWVAVVPETAQITSAPVASSEDIQFKSKENAKPGGLEPKEERSNSHKEEWDRLCTLAHKCASEGKGSEKEVVREFEDLVRRRNPYALKVRNDQLAENYDPSHPTTSSAYKKGAVLFRPFSPELQMFRG